MSKARSRVDIEEDHNLVREQLKKTWLLIDKEEPGMMPTLICSKCGCYRKHRPSGVKRTLVTWEAEGHTFNSTAARNMYVCMECGEERAYGLYLGPRNIE